MSVILSATYRHQSTNTVCRVVAANVEPLEHYDKDSNLLFTEEPSVTLELAFGDPQTKSKFFSTCSYQLFDSEWSLI